MSNQVGAEILPEIYHFTEDTETISFDELSDKYVIKLDNLLGGKNFIIGVDDIPNKQLIINECQDWFSQTYGQMKEGYWYEDIPPKLIVEKYIDSKNHKTTIDYKFLVFHGEVKVIHVTYNRFDDKVTKRNFMTETGILLMCNFISRKEMAYRNQMTLAK